MRAKRLAEVEKPVNVAAPMLAAESPRPNPAYEESSNLVSEARRALKRAVAHAAQNDLSYDLNRTAAALKALDY
jgi:hypothetical protein